MSSLRPASTIFVFLLLSIFSISLPTLVNCISADTIIDSPLLTSKIETHRAIIVNLKGGDNFTSVQAAIDAVPDRNSQWTLIHLRPGVYREKVNIPESKPYIFMRGNGKGKTKIIWNDSSTDNVPSATFTVKAQHFIAWGISFENQAPVGIEGAKSNRSVAAYVAGDMAAFYRCGFHSKHNTLFDAKGRHYYDASYITGSIDFIFGRARSVFHNCEIFVVADKRTQIRGSITAQMRHNEKENSGFVFLKGKVYGIGIVYLGRARAAYSTVIFAETYLSMTISPDGWSNWSYDGSTENLKMGEYKTRGPGANPSKRVPWAWKLSKEEIAPYMSIAFIDGKEWLPVYLDEFPQDT